MSETKNESFFRELEKFEPWKRLKDGLIQRKYDELTASAPELDPQNPQFDPEKFKAATEKQISEIVENLSVTEKALCGITTSAAVTAAEQFENAIKEPLQQISTSLTALYGSKSAEELTRIVNIATRALNVKLLVDVQPFLKAELEKPEYEGKQINELSPELQTQALTNAQKALSAATDKEESVSKEILTPITKPNNFNFLNSKIANNYISLQDILTHIEADGQLTFLPLDAEDNKQSVRVRKATKKTNEVLSIVSLTYNGKLEGKAAKRNSYDDSVMNTIYTLLEAGNTSFFVDDIYKVMTQKEKATDKQIARILSSMNKSSGHVIRIDVSDEIKKGLLKIDDDLVTGGVLEDNLLHFRKLYLKTEKGNIKPAVQILAEPVLLAYSKGKNQIISEPVSLLSMSCRATEETISIRDYLIREIHQLKHNMRSNANINYDALLSYIGFDQLNKSRTEKNRVTNEVTAILDGFIEKGFISGYEIINGQRNKILDFKIKLEKSG